MRGPRVRRRRLSVASRLAGAVILAGALTVGVASVVGLQAGGRAVDEIVDRRLGATRVAEQYELSAYLAGVRGTVSGVASSPMTAEAIVAFSDAFPSLRLAPGVRLTRMRTELLDHYGEAVVPVLEAATGRPHDPRRLLPETSAGVHLQHLLLVEGSADLGAGPGVDAAGESSAAAAVRAADELEWLRWYATYDLIYRDIADRLAADELVLVDADGTVVYAARSSPDVGTNLFVGPHSGQALAMAARRTIDGELTDVELVGLVMYAPALGRPVWFAVAPVVDDGEVIGAIALRWTVDPINQVFAADIAGGQGVGDTGEVYAAGADRLLRSDPRAFRESPAQYLADAVAAGTLSPEQAALIRARGTTALVQRADGDVVAAATTGEAGVMHRTDHLGREAIMSFGLLDDADLDVVVVSQVAAAEPGAAQDDVRRTLIFAAVMLVAVLTFAATAWAQHIVRPLRLVGDRIAARRVRGDGAPDPDAVPIASTYDEFARLVEGFESMQTSLADRRIAVEEAYGHRRDVLRALLPPWVAARVEAGDRSFVDRVASASVIVVVLYGPDGEQVSTIRNGLDEIVALLDEVAHRHGVDRIKLVGDTYFAGVGHLHPYLDHTRRAAAFAADLLATVARRAVIGAGHDRPAVNVAIGLASGPVSVGLGGSTHLVFDVWGTTVNDAYRLARRAPIGTTLLTDAIRDRLPGETAVHRVELPGGAAWALDVAAGAGVER